MGTRMLAVLAVFVAAFTPSSAQELFRLAVDPDAATPISDSTGRHDLTANGVPDVDPDGDPEAPDVPGSVVATNVTAPDGSRAALFDGGWLSITTSNPSYADDLVFPNSGRRVISFWFRSAGNGTNPASGYGNRMHALGFGNIVNNLDADFGDSDSVGPLGQTACWTYWDGPGNNNVIDLDHHDPSFYLDDQWHHYRLIREPDLVTVRMDGAPLGTLTYSGQLGSLSAGNYIGRCSDFNVGGEPLPWFGYIAGFTIIEDSAPPVLSHPASISVLDKKIGPPGEVVTFSVSASDDVDPTPTVICTPASGSTFPPGTTTVTCKATDASGNESFAAFTVTVRPSARQGRL